jgi:hypothetical protein
MDESQFLRVLKPYYEAFAEHDEGRRLELLRLAMTPDTEIWGPIRVFAGYQQISEKISGFHRNWPGCRLVLDTGLNIFLNSARIGGAIVGLDGAARARGEAVVELAPDGRSSGTHFPRSRLLGLANLLGHLGRASCEA